MTRVEGYAPSRGHASYENTNILSKWIGVCKGVENDKSDKVMLQWCEQPKFDIVFNTIHKDMRNQDDNVSST